MPYGYGGQPFFFFKANYLALSITFIFCGFCFGLEQNQGSVLNGGLSLFCNNVEEKGLNDLAVMNGARKEKLHKARYQKSLLVI